MAGWLAIYSDRSEYASSTTTWAELPETGVQVVVVFFNDGTRQINDGADWYWLEDERVRTVSSGPWGTWKERPDLPCRSCVKQGEGIDDAEFAVIQGIARARHLPTD